MDQPALPSRRFIGANNKNGGAIAMQFADGLSGAHAYPLVASGPRIG